MKYLNLERVRVTLNFVLWKKSVHISSSSSRKNEPRKAQKLNNSKDSFSKHKNSFSNFKRKKKDTLKKISACVHELKHKEVSHSKPAQIMVWVVEQQRFARVYLDLHFKD